jgi:PAS domain S-box-containing protein
MTGTFLRTILVRYLLAVVVVSLTIGLARVPVLRPDCFLLFTFATTVIVWRWGLGPGLAAILTGTLLLDYYLLPPINSLGIDDPDDLLRLSSSALIGLASGTIGRYGHSLLLHGTGAGPCEVAILPRGRAAELERIEQCFDILVAAFSDGAAFRLSPDGQIRKWYMHAMRFTGYSAKELSGRHLCSLFADETPYLAQSYLGLATELEQFEGTKRCVRKDGSRFPAHLVIVPIWDVDEPPNDGRDPLLTAEERTHLSGYFVLLRDLSAAPADAVPL